MNTNMENFTSIESLYTHLEESAAIYKYSHQIGKLFQQVRDLKHKENNLDEAEKAQWEIDFFNFSIEEDRLEPMFNGTNEKGEVVEYPSFIKFDNKTYEYLISRLENTVNPLLKARYSHILWCSPIKHIKYAKIAADSYLQLINSYEEKDKKEPQEHYGLNVLESAKSAYSISFQIKYKTANVKSEFIRLITAFNFESSSSFVVRADLIELMLKNAKRFSKKDFIGFEEICHRLAESLTKVGNIQGAIKMLEIGEQLDRKLEKKTYNWRRIIAESYEALLKQAEKDNNLASHIFCQYALENYKKLKDKKKIDELEKKYSELKKSMKFKEFKPGIDLTEHKKKCKEFAKKIVQNNSDKIIEVLMINKNLLPKYKDMERLAEEDSKKFIASQLFTEVILDQSGHLSQHFSDGDEKKYYNILQQYNWELELNKIHLVNEIFLVAIRRNKLSPDTLLRFLNEHSWFGKTISKKIANKIIEYNWLSLIAPSLVEYFIQMRHYFSNPNYPPNLVLSIDSLALKIEGLIRDMCQFSGVTTFYMTKDSKGRNIEREKDIHALLYEAPVKKLFDEDDLLFFRFLLVEKAGYNLRHKIAHSLMSFHEYNILYFHLLIMVLLRLGRYDFRKEEKSNSRDKK